MSEYTPTTEEVRGAFRKGSRLGWHSRRGRLFDRWLAQVRAEAWDEGWDDGASWPQPEKWTNPYREETE